MKGELLIMIIRVKAFVSEFGTMGSMVCIRSAKCNYPWSRFELGWVTACWKKYIYVRFSLFWVSSLVVWIQKYS